MTARWAWWRTCCARSASPVTGCASREVENLFARRGTGSPHFCWAGHTDVVPPGDKGWTDDPFAASVRDGALHGRGACDMKGGVAAFLAGLADFIGARPDHAGSISLLITGDEEGAAVDGTVRVLEWMEANGHIPDMALVGEPTSRVRLGDTVKTRPPRQPERLHHAPRHAGPQRLSAARRQSRPSPGARAAPPDRRTARRRQRGFEPSTLQVTGFDVGNTASNVIPAEARAMLNIRFNDRHSGAALTEMLHAALRAEEARYDLRVSSLRRELPHPARPLPRPPRCAPWSAPPARGRRSTPAAAPRMPASSPATARLRSSGGVGSTMHQVDERVPVAELRALAALYRTVLEEVLA